MPSIPSHVLAVGIIWVCHGEKRNIEIKGGYLAWMRPSEKHNSVVYNVNRKCVIDKLYKTLQDRNESTLSKTGLGVKNNRRDEYPRQVAVWASLLYVRYYSWHLE